MSTSTFSYCTRFVCCTINYKFSSLKQYIFIISQMSGNGSSLSTVQSLTRLQSRCWLELGFLLRLGVLFQADIVVGRIHLAAIEHIEAYFFKANGRLSLFRKVLVSLSHVFTNEVRPTQESLPFDYLKCK